MQITGKILQPEHLRTQPEGDILDVFGPTIEFLVGPTEPEETVCLMRGVVPRGVAIPLHSHSDPERFYVLSGEIRVLVESSTGRDWLNMTEGDFLQIAGGRKHAFQNSSGQSASLLILTTPRLGKFFQEVGKVRRAGAASEPPTPEDLQRFVSTAVRYEYWLGDAEENAAVGISIL